MFLTVVSMRATDGSWDLVRSESLDDCREEKTLTRLAPCVCLAKLSL